MNRVAGAAEARITRAGIGVIALACFPRNIDIGQDVMNDAAVSRSEFDGRDVFVFRQAGRHDEAAVDIFTGRGNFEVGAGVEDQVGRAELPVVGELGRRRQVGRVSFGRVIFGPGDDRGDLLLGKRANVAELGADVRGCFPGRHHAIIDDRGDIGRAFPRLVVGLQAGTDRPGRADGIPGSSSG